VARVAVERGLATWPVRIVLPGGVLTVSPSEDNDRLWLEGSVHVVDDGTL
jgi:diaminopimelate epimerase